MDIESDIQSMAPEAILKEAMPVHGSVRERLLSFMVHEMRNPLASALWSSEILERQSAKAVEQARVERLAGLSARSMRRLRALLEDFFALERLPPRFAPGQVELHVAIERSLAPRDLEPKGLQADVRIEHEVFSPLDPNTVDKLLFACFRRAAHVSDGGPFNVVLSRAEGRGLLTIERPEVELAVLDPPNFASEGSSSGGTAFALWLARSIAEKLGVQLLACATPAGAALQLSFPLARH